MPISSPVIGIPALSMTMDGHAPGLERVYVNQDYVRSLNRAGAVAVILPASARDGDAQAQLERVDALLLPGGPDLSPLTYGEQPCWGLGETFPEEDEHQLAMARLALDRGLPLLAICRGMQALNVAAGGTLYQDLVRHPEGCLQHVQKGRRHHISHRVDLAGDSRLARVFQRPSIGVNSFHHQAVKDLAPGFRITGTAPDGIVEAIESASGAPVLGVQWHPEAMAERHPEMLALFSAWVDEIRAVPGRKPGSGRRR
jgi:putative glutamine amidotransferase